MINTHNESSLHRELKFQYAGSKGRTEAEIGGFVADCVNAKGEYIEIQTGSFGPLKKKAKEIAVRGKVKIVYPVIVTKYIEVYDTGGKLLYRRKSPRKSSPWDLFRALVYAPELPLVKGVTVEIALVDVDEKRVKDGKGSWRRKGVSIHDRKMTAFHSRICLKKPADYRSFIPFAKNKKFTSALLGKKAGIDAGIARKALYVLVKIGVVEKIGKRGNAFVFRSVF